LKKRYKNGAQQGFRFGGRKQKARNGWGNKEAGVGEKKYEVIEDTKTVRGQNGGNHKTKKKGKYQSICVDS